MRLAGGQDYMRISVTPTVPISAITPRSVCSLQLPELSPVERRDG